MRWCQRARAFTGRAASDAQFVVTYDALQRRLLIRAEDVSQQHAHLTLKQTGNNNEQWEVVIVDDTSHNGTFLLTAGSKRKLRVQPGKECPVRCGARILFAGVKLVVQDVSMRAPRAVATGGGEGASPSDGDSATDRGHGANGGGDSGGVEAGGESSGIEAEGESSGVEAGDESGGVEAGGSADWSGEHCNSTNSSRIGVSSNSSCNGFSCNGFSISFSNSRNCFSSSWSCVDIDPGTSSSSRRRGASKRFGSRVVARGVGEQAL